MLSEAFSIRPKAVNLFARVTNNASRSKFFSEERNSLGKWNSEAKDLVGPGLKKNDFVNAVFRGC